MSGPLMQCYYGTPNVLMFRPYTMEKCLIFIMENGVTIVVVTVYDL